MARLYNIARMHTATLGAVSLIDLGNAVTGFLSFTNAGVTDGVTVSYAINDPRGGGSEVGSGVYHSSGPSFTRMTVEKSSSGTSRISLSVYAEIMIAPSAADLNKLYGIPDITTDNVAVRWDGTSGAFQDSPVVIGDAGSAMSPATSDNMALGTATKMWADIFLASGAVINWDNGDVTLTHAANALAFAGASSGYTFDAVVKPSANDAAALGSSAVSWADLFLASGAVINWNNGDVTLTHFADGLTFAGATNGYFFGGAIVAPSANDGTALGQSTGAWSDLFLASGGVINWNNGNATGTHAADALSWAVASQNILEFAKNAAGSGTYLRLFAGNSAGFQNCEFDVVSDISAAGVSFRMKGDWPFVIHAPSDQSASAKMAMYEQESNGTNRMVWQAAASIGTDFTLVWPAAVPAVSDVPLCCTTGGVLSFNTAPRVASLSLTDGISAPTAVSGIAQIYVDTADGDLKIRFGDNTTKTIVVDT